MKARERYAAFKAGTGIYAPKTMSMELRDAKQRISALQAKLDRIDAVRLALRELSLDRGGPLDEIAFRGGLAFAAKKLREVMR